MTPEKLDSSTLRTFRILALMGHIFTVLYVLQSALLLASHQAPIPHLAYVYQWSWVVACLLLHSAFLFLYIFYPAAVENPLSRAATILSAMLPSVVNQVMFRAMEAGHIGVLAVFFGSSLVLFDLKQESKWAMGTLISYSALALIAQYVLSPQLAIAEESVIAHLPLMRLGWQFLLLISFILLLRSVIQKDKQLHALLMQEKAILAEKEALIGQLKLSQEEAEARYAEAQRLQEELQREMARTRLAARYEALMRDQYGRPLPDFLRALLEHLQDDLGFIAGLAYQAKGGMYEVVATYALPQYVGRTFSGGLLETAAAVQKPYLVPISLENGLPLPSLAQLRPRYALYLPIYTDVAEAGVLAVLEMLFIHAPDAEKVELIGELMPRLGSYLQMQRVR
jgi:hypothetical protein